MREQKLKKELERIKIKKPTGEISQIVGLQPPGVAILPNAKLISLELIEPNPNQPRKFFSQKTIEELAASIKERGIIHPIKVRPKENKYEIITGERRLRAAYLAGLKEIPCIVSEQNDAESYIDSLIENIQREDLNPLDRAEALRHLRVHLGAHSWEEVGKRVGLKRRHIYHLLGLAELPEEILKDIRSGALTEKHGRALKQIMKDRNLLNEVTELIKKEGLSGDETLLLVKILKSAPRCTLSDAFKIVKNGSFFSKKEKFTINASNIIEFLSKYNQFLANFPFYEIKSEDKKELQNQLKILEENIKNIKRYL